MGDGIERACNRHGDGQGGHQFRIVEDYLGLNLRVGEGALLPVLGLAEDRRRLRSSIGRRHHDLRQIGAVGYGLAKPGGRAAAHRHEHVRLDLAGMRDGLFGDRNGRVHRRAGEDACRAATQRFRKTQNGIGLLGRGEKECPSCADAFEFGGQFPPDAGSEAHPHRRAVRHEFPLKKRHPTLPIVCSGSLARNFFEFDPKCWV